MKLITKNNGRDGVYEVTPADAQRFLDGMPKNRPLKEWKAKEIAEDMRTGRWTLNGEPLIFDSAGHLIDGQHRCRACILANRPFTTYIVYGITARAAAFDTIDSGSARTPADGLALDGNKYWNMKAAVIVWLVSYEQALAAKGAMTRVKVRRATTRITNERHKEEIAAACEAVVKYQRSLKRLIPPALASFVYLMAKRQNPERADRFLAGLATGEGLTAHNPVLAIRSRLIEQAAAKAKLPEIEILALAIKAWLLFRDGRTVTLLRWRSTDPYPQFEGEQVLKPRGQRASPRSKGGVVGPQE